MDSGERLQKILAQWGIASRRQAEQMILDGRVWLNGEPATLGQKADPHCDRIQVDGRTLQSDRPDLLYLLLYKPTGVISTCSDPQGRPTILDLLPPHYRNLGLHPVGRLDSETTGALLITNDGWLTHALTHPCHQVSKVYQVWVSGHPPESVLQQWRDGVMLAGRLTLPAQVRLLERTEIPSALTCLEVILWEGRNRQIRRVAKKLGYPVVHLHRTGIGPVQLQATDQPTLAKGHYRHLTPGELEALREQVGILSIAAPARV
uniref:Pseudouridine synthase n=1 Tax=Cyanothece sp. (strain PCC 7425 / ATCC 29141) TaxID=395961 RepID=B8HSY9_CYAP4